MDDLERPWPFNSKALQITMGICGDAQESSFGNATLQSTQGPYKADLGQKYLEFSIAVHVDVPKTVQGEDELARYLGGIFGDIVHRHPGLSVEIQIGPPGDGEDEEEDGEEDEP